MNRADWFSTGRQASHSDWLEMLLRSQFSRLLLSTRSIVQNRAVSSNAAVFRMYNFSEVKPLKVVSSKSIFERKYSTDLKDPNPSKFTEPPKPSNPDEPAPKTLTEKLKAFFKQYGKLGLGIYLGVTAISFSSIYLTLRSGVDVKELMRKVGLPKSSILDGAGTVAVAYAIHKLLMPVRLFLTVALTTWVVKRAPKWGWNINTFGRSSGEKKR